MAESSEEGCPARAVRRRQFAEAAAFSTQTAVIHASGSANKLLARLKTAEETLRAIQSGEVDALMVSGRRGEQVVSLKGGEPAYRLLVEAMSEGAATLSRNGAVLYCNRRFAELMGRPPGKMVGVAVQSLVAEAERDRFETLLAEAQKAVAKGEFTLRRRDGSLIPGLFVSQPVSRIQGPGAGHGDHRSERAETQAGRRDRAGPKRCTGSCWNARFRRKRRNGDGLRANCTTKQASC